MRTFVLAAILALAGCAHKPVNSHNLAQRQRTTPRGDFERAAPPVQSPSVTPPIR